MALQTSGAISISQIKTELGSSSNSLRALSDAAGFSTPDSMSEFYGYSNVTPSTHYWQGDGVNDTLRFTNHSSTLFHASTSQDFTYSGWFRIDETSNAVQWLGSFSEASPTGNNMIFIMYNSTTARMMFRYRKGGGGNFHQVFRSLYSSNNLPITGVSSAGWKSDNRGNVNSDGFVHLTFVYDASDRTQTGMKIYWNAQNLPDVNQFNSLSLAAFDVRSVAIGDAVSSSPNNSNVFKGGIDQVSCYSKALTQTEITALYNNGVPITGADAGVTSNLMAEYRLENNTTNTTGTFPSLTNTGGTFQQYT